MRLLGFLASYCFAFQISIKQTHTGVEKRSKTIQLPGAFADLTIRKGDKVTYSAETTEDFTQLIIALKGKHGESLSFYLAKPLTIVQIADQDPTIKPGMYACTIYAVKGSESKAFKIGNLQISGEVAVTDVKPELFHTFKPPQKQGSMVLAVIFTALVLSPVFVLGALWTSLNVKLHLKKFELWPWLYMLSLGISLSIFHLFWLKLNLFQFFGVAAPVALLTIATGKKALTLHASKI